MADAQALGALARTALLEVTRDDTIGEQLDVVEGPDGTLVVSFANTLPGYPGWIWTVAVATVEGQEPTVLETELIPGDDSLLAPDWVPWVERLAEYEASQEAEAGAAGGTGDESDDDESDDDDDDSDDDDSDSDDDDDESDDDESDDDESDDDDSDDEDDDEIDSRDTGALRDQFDGIDVEEAAEAAGLDESGDDDEDDDSDRP